MNLAGLRFSGRVQLGLAAVLAAAHAGDGGRRPAARQHCAPAPPSPRTGGPPSARRRRCWSGASPAGRRSPRSPATTATRAATCRAPPASRVVVVGVLYLGLAATSVLVLGPATGPSQAPLSDLLAHRRRRAGRGSSPPSSPCCSRVGAMNAYFAGGSRLGAALARDGALPAWLARGGERRRGAAPQHRPRRRPARCCRSPSRSCSTSGSRRSCCSPPAASRSSTSSARPPPCACCPRGTAAGGPRSSRSCPSSRCSSSTASHALWALGLVVLSLAYRSRRAAGRALPAPTPRLRRRDRHSARSAHP